MESLKTLSFEALTMLSPASGYSVFLAACAEGDLEEVRSILSFSPNILDTLIALKTPTLIVRDLGTPSRQGIQEIFEQETKAMENVSLIYLAAKIGSVHHTRKLASMGVTLNNISQYRKDEFSSPLCLAASCCKQR